LPPPLLAHCEVVGEWLHSPFGGDAVLEGTPTKTALYSGQGFPFEKEGPAPRPFPTVVLAVSRLRLLFPRSESKGKEKETA
jgi:hypothetical protein